MAYVTKRRKAIAGIVKEGRFGRLEEALAAIERFPRVNFDETVELHLNLNIDPKKSDQMVRGTVVLPHGTGKTVRIAVFCRGEAALQAREAGADVVGDADLIEKVAGGFLDFDRVVATPDMMRELSRLGKILGPRGLMPSPKAGTVTMDVARVIREIKAGRVEFKSDKQGGVHAPIGKRSYPVDRLRENAEAFLEAVEQAKPSVVKGALIKSLSVSTTMGPGLRVAAV